MKCLQRYFCVLLCLVSLLGVFSVNASAEELETSPYHIYASAYLYVNGSVTSSFNGFNFFPSNGTIEKSNPSLTSYDGSEMEYMVRTSFKIATDDKSVLAKGGLNTSFTLSNVYYSVLAQSDVGSFYFNKPDSAVAYIFYTDGTADSTEAVEVTANSSYRWCDIEITYEPKKDVESIEVLLYQNISGEKVRNEYTITNHFGEYDGDDKHQLTIIQPSKEEGLLSGIWDSISSGFSALGEKVTGVINSITDGFREMGTKLNNVWTSITDGFKDMGTKLTNLLDSILELPRKIWGLIEDGLKSLFIPSAESFQEMKSKFDSLLEEKLGVLYQVGSLITEYWEDIMIADERNEIEIPVVEIPIGDEKTFKFGGYSVEIVPDGFGAIALTCKLVTSIIATFAVLNTFRRRYEELLHT